MCYFFYRSKKKYKRNNMEQTQIQKNIAVFMQVSEHVSE